MPVADVAALERLCADRAQDDYSEFFPPNAWYGAAAAIRTYCGWPDSRPLPMVVPHALDYTVDALWRAEVEAPLPAIYCFHDYRDELYRRSSSMTVLPGCSPWLYLLATDGFQPTRDRAVLIMPAHSTMYVRTELDHDRLIDLVAERFPGRPLRCCMYWRDVQHGDHIRYLERGIPVVTAGHAFNAEFLRRLRGILEGAEHVVTNEFGSNVCYAAGAGVPVTVMPQVQLTWVGDPQKVAHDCEVGVQAPLFLEYEPLFTAERPDIVLQQPAALRLMGQQRMSTPDALHDLLETLWREHRLGLRRLLRPTALRKLVRAARRHTGLTGRDEHR